MTLSAYPDDDAMAPRSPTFAISLYRAVGRLLTPLAPALLSWRARRGKEDPSRRGERLGYARTQRPDGAVIWLHGASIGEALSALPLCARLLEETGTSVVFTTGTVTSAAILEKRLPVGAVHQFVPLDLPGPASRFLDHWQPDLAIFIESEIWPGLLSALAARQIPAALVNARISERSATNWAKLGTATRAVFDTFDAIAAQSEADAERLRTLTGTSVTVTGNLKFDADPVPVDADDLAKAKNAVAGRPIIAAASTHPGEEDAVIDAHRVLRDRFPGLLTVLAPRHPQRGDDVAATLSAAGLNAKRRSNGNYPDAQTDVWLIDTVGDLGLVYSVAAFAFCGGSLTPRGGQNPMEPAREGVAILTGPSTYNFADVYSDLQQASGAVSVDNASELADACAALLSDPQRAETMGRAAQREVARQTGATERTMAILQPFLNGRDR